MHTTTKKKNYTRTCLNIRKICILFYEQAICKRDTKTGKSLILIDSKMFTVISILRTSDDITYKLLKELRPPPKKIHRESPYSLAIGESLVLLMNRILDEYKHFFRKYSFVHHINFLSENKFTLNQRKKSKKNVLTTIFVPWYLI